MAAEWRHSLFGDVCEHSAFGPRFSSDEYAIDGNVACLRTTDIDGNGRIDFAAMPLARLDLARFRNHILQRDDLVITRTGAYLGKAAVFSDFRLPVLPGAFSIRFRLKRDIADPLFFRYYFNSRDGQAAIHSIATGSVQPNLNIPNLHSLVVPLPPLVEQEAIASMIGALDDKIELNRRMNATLEAMARARFQSWFVDFDPVRAKLDGRQLTGLDPVTAALFPDEFEESEFGSIPKGWRIGKVSDMSSTQYGYTASATDEPIGPRFLRVMDINKQPWINWSSVPYCNISQDDKARYALFVGDILVARMADPGKSAIVEQEVDAVFASYLVRLKTESLAHAYYLYYHLKSPAYGEYSAGAMSGSVQANMNAKVIVAAELVIPPAPILEKFVETILPLRQQIAANLDQSRSLATIRDTLLPKLLNGQFRIPT